MAHFIPTERDKEVLNWMLQQIRNTPVNAPPPSVIEPRLNVQPGTGTYIAKVPESGIPGMETDEGEDTGTGSGTEGESDDTPTPKRAKCVLYKIATTSNGPELRRYETLEKWVYNITSSKIASGYTLVVQLADGKWVAVRPEIAAHGFGKLDQSVTKGRLTADETVSIWKGPAFDPDEDTERNLVIHYATDDMDSGTYVTWSRVGAHVYVTPWECPE